MPQADVGTTSSSQLRAVGDWGNHPAWIEFQQRYDPLVAGCCARFGLHGADADEVRQETWIAVARRMKTFAYDPRGSFRGWVWKVCQHEAMNFLKRRKTEQVFCLDKSYQWRGSANTRSIRTTPS